MVKAMKNVIKSFEKYKKKVHYYPSAVPRLTSLVRHELLSLSTDWANLEHYLVESVA